MGKADPKLYERPARLIKETAREPFTGLGKPEATSASAQGLLVAQDQ